MRPPLSEAERAQALAAVEKYGNMRKAAAALGIPYRTFQSRVTIAKANPPKADTLIKLSDVGYNLESGAKTPQEAWDSHASVVERKLSEAVRKTWPVIERPDGAYVIFHATDPHVDDNSTPLRLLEADIRAAHDLDAVMCHGGDLLNNWPLAGRLAKKWADQECTMPDALLRAQYYIDIFQPDAWVDGNHEEMNPYLSNLFSEWLPEDMIRDYWMCRFVVRTPNGRDCRVSLTHKFGKGNSWFHRLHGHIREMLEAEEADLLIDGHLHSDGVLEHTLPERQHSSLAVASAGYKVLDSFATRISKGGKFPKIRGRAHWIVVDDQADYDANFCTAFKCPRQAEAYLNGLQNLRML